MHAMLNVAVMAARSGGNSLVRNLNKLDKLKVELKGRNDFVSDADFAAERAVIETIYRHYPDHAIQAEESGMSGESDHVWIIDPLDGTTNYLHGFPVFCVSVGLQVKGRIEHGVVYDPLRQELFTASRGQGAHLDGRRIRVSGLNDLSKALIGTGFPYRASNEDVNPYMRMLVNAMAHTSGVRRPGAAALALCYVAARRSSGRFLGDGAHAVGPRSRHTDHPGSRRHRQRAGWFRKLSRYRAHSLWHTEDIQQSCQALCAGHQGHVRKTSWGHLNRVTVSACSESR